MNEVTLKFHCIWMQKYSLMTFMILFHTTDVRELVFQKCCCLITYIH